MDAGRSRDSAWLPSTLGPDAPAVESTAATKRHGSGAAMCLGFCDQNRGDFSCYIVGIILPSYIGELYEIIVWSLF